MMMDERPDPTTDEDAELGETGVKSSDGAQPGTTQRSGSGDTRRTADGSGDTR